MVERQSGNVTIDISGDLNVKRFQQWLMMFLLLSCMFYGHTVQAVEGNAFVAMGDIGAIKFNAESGDTPQQTWSQLSEEQRSVLAPLGTEWDTLRPWQREKMLDIARDYPKMDAQKQERVKKRLNRWSRMTPYERENARQRYQQFHSLSPEKKDEVRKKWAEHQKSADKNKNDGSEIYYDPELD